MARSAAMLSAPIGPAPSTSTRSPGLVPPWWMPWSATDSGSASAAARGSSPSGIGQHLGGRRQLVGGEGAVLHADAGRAARLAERRPVGLAHPALAAAEPGPADDHVARLPAWSRRRRPRRSCRSTRGRASCPARPSPPAPCAGRCRRCRTARPRRARRRRPTSGTGTCSTSISPAALNTAAGIVSGRSPTAEDRTLTADACRDVSDAVESAMAARWARAARVRVGL